MSITQQPLTERVHQSLQYSLNHARLGPPLCDAAAARHIEGLCSLVQDLAAALSAKQEQPAAHVDDVAIDSFADAMKSKLAAKRAEGRSGWDDKSQCSQQHLSKLLGNHVAKGDPVDVANFAMMLHQRGESILPAPAGGEAVASHPVLTVWYGSMPESNGCTNWTAILHRRGSELWKGITIVRSEYPDRVRYEADRIRYLIGEIATKPSLLDYDANKHSGYVPTTPGPQAVSQEAVAYWAAVDSDGNIVNSLSADDGNGGEAARQEINDYINDVLLSDGITLHLVPLYAHPAAPSPQAVPDRQQLMAVIAGACATADRIRGFGTITKREHGMIADAVEALLAAKGEC